MQQIVVITNYAKQDLELTNLEHLMTLNCQLYAIRAKTVIYEAPKAVHACSVAAFREKLRGFINFFRRC